ncbi:hypothetical protein ACEWY4_009648 [Coilia grayii]|uniref:Receptor protein-tyrosine kinase n=1 Tax=Coilia grayii TaxID=363190 RepID=A0ABD1K766_9TELE
MCSPFEIALLLHHCSVVGCSGHDVEEEEEEEVGPPSAPRNINPEINDTSVTLEWSEPVDSGGRSDVSYAVECALCPPAGAPGGSACGPCGDSVSYRPSQRGLAQRRATVWGLRPHTTYTFTVHALNGVSQYNSKGSASDSVNITTSRHVPVVVTGIRKSVATESSATLQWPVPAQTHYSILEYQLRYCEKDRLPEEQSCRLKKSDSNQVVLSDLRRATLYEVQVRARTMAGFGNFSRVYAFRTLPDEDDSSSPLWLPGCSSPWGCCSSSLSSAWPSSAYEIEGTLDGQSSCVIDEDTLASEVNRLKDPELNDKNGQYLMGHGVKVYIDPFTYEDPNEAVREFAKEIDVSFVKIEEVIGAGEFGEVCRGRLKIPGKKENYVAIKTLKGGYTDKQRRDFLAEASIMGQFQHPTSSTWRASSPPAAPS